MTWIAGVDGCRGGWIRVSRHVGTGELRCDLVTTAAELLRTAPVPRVLAIDVPIGLPAAGPRRCDVEARRRLGPRRSSVFPAPIRPMLAASSHAEASAIGSATDGRRLSAQAWGILPKIREVDAWLRADAEARERVREVHPELAFLAWNGGRPMMAAKRAAAGRRERLALVEGWLGSGLLERARGRWPRRLLADDDVLDAVAALWTAARVERGEAEEVPAEREVDDEGLPMRIVY